MYTIKHTPEEFIVKEVRDLKVLPEGEHTVFEMTKKNHSTVQAIQRLARKLRKPLKDLGFAGNKDRRAITTQYISIRNAPSTMESLQLNDITFQFKGYKKRRISLGDLDGNAFLITVRNLEEGDLCQLNGFMEWEQVVPNFFGPQRFSTHNHKVGKFLLRKKFKEAVELTMKYEGEYECIMRKYFNKYPTDNIGALRKIPRYIKGYFISSYQSLLFNRTVYELLKQEKPLMENRDIPLLGFGTEVEELDSDLKQITTTILKEENITLRDFIIPQFPELSLEGSRRKLFFTPKDFTVKEVKDDEIFLGKKKCLLSFTLDKSCYATTLLSFVFQDRKNALHHFVEGRIRINVSH